MLQVQLFFVPFCEKSPIKCDKQNTNLLKQYQYTGITQTVCLTFQTCSLNFHSVMKPIFKKNLKQFETFRVIERCTRPPVCRHLCERARDLLDLAWIGRVRL